MAEVRSDTMLLDFLQSHGDKEFTHWLIEDGNQGLNVTRSTGNYADKQVHWPVVEAEDLRSAISGMMDIYEQMQQGQDGEETDA